MHVPAALQNEADKASSELEVKIYPNFLQIKQLKLGQFFSCNASVKSLVDCLDIC